MSRGGDRGLGIDFNFPWQKGFINNRGDTVIHETGLRCTCNREDTAAGMIEKGPSVLRRNTKFNCPICSSYGFIYRKPTKIVGLVNGFSENKNVSEAGWAYPGDVFLSVKPGYNISGGDKITFTWDEEVPDGQVLIRGAAQINDNAARKTQLEESEDRLWYDANKSIYCEDSEGHVYSCNSDFILNGSKVIRWVGSSPQVGQPYTIKYTAYIEWIAFMPPMSRRDRDRDLGSRVALRKRHVALVNDDPTISLSDKMPFCDRISSVGGCT